MLARTERYLLIHTSTRQALQIQLSQMEHGVIRFQLIFQKVRTFGEKRLIKMETLSQQKLSITKV